jgi:hypothetical protein
MYATAREFFEAARSAAREADRIGRELAEMEASADATGGWGFEPRVRSTPEPDRMASRVASKVDREGMLERRQEEDYRLIDAACAVLYGPDNRSGLYALVGWPADAIWHHYLGLRTWEEVADMMGYSVRHVQSCVRVAFELADANGQMWTELGVGMAE